MNMNHLPPQAYTKEMLVQAYQWLKTQPLAVQEMAQSSDVLISLYKKSLMHGNGALEKPSLQNFKSELKSLAGRMVEFDEPSFSSQASKPQISHNPSPTLNHQSSNYNTSLNTAETNLASAETRSLGGPTPDATTILINNLDPRSLQMIREVKNQLNMSSDTEVLRMLITLGYSKAKNLL